jgi:peptidyl-prolyl cis-trans isomerase C
MRIVLLGLLTLSAAALPSCNRTPPGTVEMNFRHPEGQGEKVATFDGDAITTSELQQRFLEMTPMGRTRFQSLEQKREYVEGLARFELLAQEALKRGLHKDPEVIHAAKQMMVQRLLRQELYEKPTPVSDAELTQYYDGHKADYVKPELVRLSHIFLAAPKEDAKKVAEQKAKAEALVKKAKALQPTDFTGFATLVREGSEDEASKARDGDLRFLPLTELANGYGPEIAAAAANMKDVGQVTSPIQTEKGWHILKLQGRQAALNLGLDDVKTQLQTRVLYERRNTNFSKLMEDLKARNHFKVNDEVLAKVEVDLKAPTKEPKGPPPGFIPAPTQRPLMR